MFYAHYVLSKKGPLAKVWLAAHWDKKLTKAHVFETDVEKTVDNIISPKVKMALRTSGHLLLGVVRIYSRKQKYLIQDLGEACAKIKMAFRPGMVDLPVEGIVANKDTITLPEIFHDLETAVADLNTLDIDEQMMMHRSRAEEITLKDDFIGASGIFNMENEFRMENDFGGLLEDIEIPEEDEVYRKSGDMERSGVSNVSQLSMIPDKNDNNLIGAGKRRESGELGDGFGDFGLEGLQELDLPGLDSVNIDQAQLGEMEIDPHIEAPPPPEDGRGQRDDPMDEDVPIIPPNDTLREGDGFVLEPLDVTFKTRQRRKRKLVIDARKELTGNQIRDQLRNQDDILQQKLAPPPSKKAFLWKENNVADYLLSNTTLSFLATELVDLVCGNFDQNVVEDTFEGTVLDLEDPEIGRKGGEVNESAVNDSIAPPSGRGSVPPTEGEGPEDVPQYDPMDFIDNIDMDIGGGGLEKIVPEMPNLEEEGEEEEGREGEGETSASGPASEQQASEKTEEFEQRRWTKRAQQMMNMLEKGFDRSDTIQFSTLTKRCSRKQAASRFYTCLLLGKEGAIRFEQDKPFSSIHITRGSLYTQS